jgi:serine protease Do
VILLVIFVLFVAACGNKSETQTPDPQVENPVVTEQVANVQEGNVNKSQAASSIKEVKDAVIQIEAQGTFVDPEVGLLQNSAGRGSGFIIDPSGIAVTNNHVVTGAALIKVWVGGDSGKVYNAKVLGVSECSDLAVIDIEGEGFSYLDWFDGPIEVGEEIYVAGFPLGDQEYSLTKGIVSKAKADGETDWASVDSVIEYDATTNPGNSGGPVVSKDGKVIAVHYAGNSDTRQAYGISRDEAKEVIDVLATGQDLDAIGVNGYAVSNEDGSVTGIWVSSVESGSPVDKANLQGGDIITKMEDLVLATDGTMSDYCDIIRSHDSGDVLDIQVLRYGQGQVLEGQLNGRELEVVYQEQPGNGDNVADDQTANDTSSDSEGALETGDYYIVSEFDGVEGWYSFTVPETENYIIDNYNSVLYIDVPEKQSTIYVLNDLDIPSPDVRVDAKVETIGGPNRNNISLVCRATEAGWYEFSMNSGGYWFIYKFQNGEYTVLTQGASYDINLKKASNELTAGCIGNELIFLVNGEEMGSVTDRTFRDGGQVGVSVSTLDIPGAEVEFDWFAASVP